MLWTKRDAYDAAHVLMVPMHAAYARRDEREIEHYRDFVRRFLHDKNRKDLGRLNSLQFGYFLSRFAALETGLGACSPVANETASYLSGEVVSIVNSPAWEWTLPDFRTLFDRIEWKLVQHGSEPSYLRSVIDEGFFALATAADLSITLSKCGIAVPAEINRAVDLGFRVLKQEGVFIDGGWVFQPGVWKDHPDYAYAGNTELANGLSKKPVDGIGLDSSHSTRFPLWLRSFQCAVSGDERLYITNVIDGLRHQFLGVVLANTDDGVRLRNFMTGDNGVYRYGYKTTGPSGGYGPYGLSFTFNLGWWSFLGPDVGVLYKKQLGALPFSAETSALYLQPIVTVATAPRPRHPQFDPKNYLKGDLIKEILLSAVEVANSQINCD